MSLAIFDKIQAYIRSKIKPDSDPTKVLAEHVAEILEDINSTNATATESGMMSATHYRKAKALPTLNSPDIEILVAPELYKSGTLLAATAGSVKYQGNTYTIPAVANISGGIAGFDNKQFFAIAAYNTGTDEFQTTALYATMIGGNMPEKLPMDNQAYLGLYQYTGGVLSELPFNYVTSVVFPDGSRAVANAKGELPMPAVDPFVPIAEDEFGTHPAFATQHEVNAYLLSGGTYTPPAPPTFGSASATPLSDTEIELTWTITP